MFSWLSFSLKCVHSAQTKSCARARGLHGAATGPRPDQAQGPGLGLVAQIMFGCGSGSGLVEMIAGKRCIEHYILGFLGPLVFRKEKVIHSCAYLMLLTLSVCGNKSHRLGFLCDFRIGPLPEIVRDNTLQTWHPISLYRSSNAKITSDVRRASLSNPLKDYWHLYINRKCINDTIVDRL
jgi:hypothetical protein